MTVLALLAVALVAAPLTLNAAVYARRWQLRRAQSCQDDSLPIAAATGAFFADCIALTVTALSWLLPSALTESPPSPGMRHTVVLVPGFGMPRSALWLLQRRLRGGGWHAPIISWRRHGLDFDAAGAALDAYLHVVPATAPPIAVLAVGLGGLVARRGARNGALIGVRSLITLGTPHAGTLAPIFAFGSLRRVRPDAPLMQQLQSDGQVTQRFDVVAISSDFDAVVTPSVLADYAGAFNIEVRGIGHFRLLYARRVWELIHENLSATVARAEPRS